MTERVSLAHARSLCGVAHRKIWLANELDLIVLPDPMCDRFKRYACGTINLDPQRVAVVSPPGPDWEPLSRRLLDSPDAIESVMQWFQQNGAGVAQCFALDEATAALFASLGIPLEGYESSPPNSLITMIYELNSKSGFRELAQNLGIPAPAGTLCEGFASLIRTLERQRGRAIVKLDRSSNGYGNFVVDPSRLSASKLEATVLTCLLAWPEQPHRFVVEEFIDWIAAPSIEFEVTSSGTRELYICNQRSLNNAWSGMITPPDCLPPDSLSEIRQIGHTVGDYLWRNGYRGVCDVDCLVDRSGRILATETNCRRTGGTFLDHLARRILHDDYADSHVWIADVVDGPLSTEFFSCLERLRSGKLLYEPTQPWGVILTANTLARDGKWRYMILGHDFQHVNDVENRLFDTLGI